MSVAATIGALGTAAAAGINAATSEARNAKSYKYTKRLQDEQNRFNAQQAQIAYDRQRELYNYQYQNERSAFLSDREHNEQYNSPLAQMQRYKQAGLNPALLTGQIGSGSANVDFSAPSMPGVDSTSSGSQGQFQMDQGFSGISSALMSMSQLLTQQQVADSQVKLNDSVSEKNEVEKANIAADTEKKGAEKSNIEKDTEKKGVEIGNISQDTAVKVAQEKLTNSQTDKVKEETRQTTYLIDKYLPKQYDEIVKRIDKMSADITNSNQITKAQVALFNKQISEIMSNIRLKNRQSELLRHEIFNYDKLAQSTLDLNEKNMKRLGFEAQRLDLQNKIQTDIFNSMYDSWWSSSPSQFRPGKKVPSFGELQMNLIMYNFLNKMMNATP